MKALLLVARREIVERRILLFAAAYCTLLPWVTRFMPGVGTDGISIAEARAGVALLLGVAFGIGGGLVVGASVLGRDLAEERRSFFLSRPLSAGALWGGKVLGGILLVLAGEAIVLVPHFVLTGFVVRRASIVLVAAALVAPLSFLVGGASSVALRSRSPWLAADLVLAVPVAVLLALAFLTIRPLLTFWTFSPEDLVAPLLFALLVLGLASYAAVARGRTDARRAHAAQTAVLWGLLVPISAAALGYARWYVSATPSDLEFRRIVSVGGDGRWVLLAGQGMNRWPRGPSFSFLWEPEGGRFVRLSGAWVARISADGSRAAFFRLEGLVRRSEVRLVTVDLRSKDLAETELPGSFRNSPDAFVLAPDGRSLAITIGRSVTVLEVPSGRLLASASVPETAGASHWKPSFAGTTVRLLPRSGYWERKEAPGTSSSPALSWSLDIPGRRLDGPIPLEVRPREEGYGFAPSPDGRTILARCPAHSGALEIDLLDATTGKRLAVLEATGGTDLGSHVFLADGRVAVVERSKVKSLLRILAKGGGEPASLPLPVPPSVKVLLGSEARPGLLTLFAGTADTDDTANVQRGGELLLADLNALSARRTGLDLLPFGVLDWGYLAADASVPAGSPAAKLFLERKKGILSGIPGEGPLKQLLGVRH